MKINLGCGLKKKEGYINCDLYSDADKRFDLNKFPYPFKDESANEILIQATLEHLEDVPRVLKECHRILKYNSKLFIKEFPYLSGLSFYEDLTHKHIASYKTFKKFEKGDNSAGYNQQYYLDNICFLKVNVKIVFGKMLFWNYLVEPIVNKFPILYENLPLLKSLFPALYLNIEIIK